MGGQPGQVYRHLKTGGLYRIIDPDALLEATREAVVVYRSLADGQTWVRSRTEFFDGRFAPEAESD